jgi:hypothetical protein
MSVSPEEFFMYLTISLVILVPVGARIYRRLTLTRTTRMLKEQLGSTRAKKDDSGSAGSSI